MKRLDAVVTITTNLVDRCQEGGRKRKCQKKKKTRTTATTWLSSQYCLLLLLFPLLLLLLYSTAKRISEFVIGMLQIELALDVNDQTSESFNEGWNRQKKKRKKRWICFLKKLEKKKTSLVFFKSIKQQESRLLLFLFLPHLWYKVKALPPFENEKTVILWIRERWIV